MYFYHLKVRTRGTETQQSVSKQAVAMAKSLGDAVDTIATLLKADIAHIEVIDRKPTENSRGVMILEEGE